MKGLRTIYIIFISLLLSGCAVSGVAKYIDFKQHPQAYAVQSAPWYTSVILSAVITAACILALTAIYFVAAHFIKRRLKA